VSAGQNYSPDNGEQSKYGCQLELKGIDLDELGYVLFDVVWPMDE
jgi:hypothetical protein